MLEWTKIAFSVIYNRPMRCRVLGYRPVVLCLVQAVDKDAYLFISPSLKPNAWMPPQEGIEPAETVEMATVRGLNVELGIAENQLHFRRSVWLGCQRIPEQKGERDIAHSMVKMRGKAYYAALIKVSSMTAITRNPAEIANYEWLDEGAISSRLSCNSQRKQAVIRNAFKKLLNKDL